MSKSESSKKHNSTNSANLSANLSGNTSGKNHFHKNEDKHGEKNEAKLNKEKLSESVSNNSKETEIAEKNVSAKKEVTEKADLSKESHHTNHHNSHHNQANNSSEISKKENQVQTNQADSSDATTSKKTKALIFLIGSTLAVFLIIWATLSSIIFINSEANTFAQYPQTQHGLTSLLTEPSFVKNDAGQKLSIRYIESNPESAVLILPDVDGVKGDGLNQLFQYVKTSSSTVAIAAYPGYDSSEGKPNYTNSLEAGVKAFDFLVSKGIAAKNITIFGNGWGGVVATYVAQQKPEAARLVLVNTPSSLQSMCFRSYSVFCAFEGFRWNTADMAKNVKVPTSIFHYKSNPIIPYSEGEKLNESFSKDAKSTLTALDKPENTHSYFNISDVLKK